MNEEKSNKAKLIDLAEIISKEFRCVWKEYVLSKGQLLLVEHISLSFPFLAITETKLKKDSTLSFLLKLLNKKIKVKNLTNLTSHELIELGVKGKILDIISKIGKLINISKENIKDLFLLYEDENLHYLFTSKIVNVIDEIYSNKRLAIEVLEEVKKRMLRKEQYIIVSSVLLLNRICPKEYFNNVILTELFKLEKAGVFDYHGLYSMMIEEVSIKQELSFDSLKVFTDPLQKSNYSSIVACIYLAKHLYAINIYNDKTIEQLIKLVKSLEDIDPYKVEESINAISQICCINTIPPALIEDLLKLINDDDCYLAEYSAIILSIIFKYHTISQNNISELILYLQCGDILTRRYSAFILASIKSNNDILPQAINELKTQLMDPDNYPKEAIKLIGIAFTHRECPDSLISILISFCKNENNMNREESVIAIGQIFQKSKISNSIIEVLVSLLNEENSSVCITAAQSLIKIFYERKFPDLVIDGLLNFLKSKNGAKARLRLNKLMENFLNGLCISKEFALELLTLEKLQFIVPMGSLKNLFGNSDIIEEVTSTLLKMLSDEDINVRRNSLYVLYGIYINNEIPKSIEKEFFKAIKDNDYTVFERLKLVYVLSDKCLDYKQRSTLINILLRWLKLCHLDEHAKFRIIECICYINENNKIPERITSELVNHIAKGKGTDQANANKSPSQLLNKALNSKVAIEKHIKILQARMNNSNISDKNGSEGVLNLLLNERSGFRILTNGEVKSVDELSCIC